MLAGLHLQVEHRPFQVESDSSTPDTDRFVKHLLLSESGFAVTSSVSGREEFVNVAPPAFAGEICVIGRRDEADCSCSSPEHVRCGVGEALEDIGAEIVVIVDDVVMRRPGRALQTAMRLKEEVEIVDRRNATIDYRSRSGIPIAIGTLRVYGVETSVMAFASDALIGSFISDDG